MQVITLLWKNFPISWANLMFWPPLLLLSSRPMACGVAQELVLIWLVGIWGILLSRIVCLIVVIWRRRRLSYWQGLIWEGNRLISGLLEFVSIWHILVALCLLWSLKLLWWMPSSRELEHRICKLKESQLLWVRCWRVLVCFKLLLLNLWSWSMS